METQAPDKPTARDVWMRGLFMLLFIIGFALGQWLLNLLTIVQFLWLLFAREPNQFIASFGNSLAIWLAEVARARIAHRTASTRSNNTTIARITCSIPPLYGSTRNVTGYATPSLR
jgi:hypothetical protein